MRFFADRPERHRAGRKALDDFFCRLDFFDRQRASRFLQLHQSAQRAEICALVVDEIGVLLEGLEAVLPNRMLQFADGERIQQVVFAVHSLVIVAAHGEFGFKVGQWPEGVFMLQLRFGAQERRARCLRGARSCPEK